MQTAKTDKCINCHTPIWKNEVGSWIHERNGSVSCQLFGRPESKPSDEGTV